MKHFLPHFIQEHYRNGDREGRMQAFTMFVDLSGFTRLTEKLLKTGAQGAEELSQALNQIFQPTVKLVYERGGFIPYFAGDSFTAIFPVNEQESARKENIARAWQVVKTAQQTLQRFSNPEAEGAILSEYNIGIKIGLSIGNVEWGIAGSRSKAFYFRGEPIDSCAEGQGYAGSMEVVCDKVFLQYLPVEEAPAKELDQGFFKLEIESIQIPEVEQFPVQALPDPDPELMKDFLPAEVIGGNAVNEFRSVVSVFLAFDGVETHDALNRFATVVLDQCQNFGGYFKEIDYGDKGGLMVVLFGAPVTFENNIERALEFVSAIQEEMHNLESLTGARYRCGMASGIAFTGVIGSDERCQYAAVGARVNLGARLMQQAGWSEVMVDENVQRNRNFKFIHKGEGRYKGFEQEIATFSLSGRNLGGRSSYSGQCIGREGELNDLINFVEPLREGRFAGVAYIFGEAGIGKSRLSFEFRSRLRDNFVVSWFNCQSDQILRKPFNPFVYFLKNYFEQSPEYTPERNRELFESNFQELIYDLEKSPLPEAEAIRREIIRTKSILAALISIFYPDSLWEQLDARGRYQNGLSAMANLFVAEAILQPLVIELEDTHWYDDMSREFLAQFLRRARQYPLLFLVTSRYEDDGSKSYIFRENTLQEIGVEPLEIDLNFLNQEQLRHFAEGRLNGKLHPDLFDLLLRMTQGNPFYAEQMADYFLEAQLLKKQEGVLQLKNQEIQISDSVKQIMMARIDRLSGLVKETVKAAAVIGREFELSVLSEVMSRQVEFVRKNGDLELVLKEQVQTAEKWQIWHAMNELRYIFRHSLLREAAYDMQLRTRLRELHLLIAEAIEKLYPESEERFVDLAFHFEQSDNKKKTNKYLEKAARYSQRNFQNRTALKFYDKLILNYQSKKKKSKKLVKFLLRKGTVHELIGQWEEGESHYRDALAKAKKLNDWYLIGRSNRRLGQLLMLRGDYTQAKKHLDVSITCFELANDQVGMAKTYGDLGTFHFRQGSYEAAKSWYSKAIEINRSLHRETENASIVANLGLIFMNQGHYDEGIRWMEEQISISEANQDKTGLTMLYTNLGIIYLEKNSLDSALVCLEKGLTLSEELGNKLYMTICIGSIGSVYEKKGDYDKAMQNFDRDLELCTELGDKQGKAIAGGLKGDLLSIIGEFEESNTYEEQTLTLSRELNYKKGIAKALNTLGDNWFYLNDYERSIKYYQEAIEYAREMGNKLVLGSSLLEKGSVCIAHNDIPAARVLLEEGRDIALALGNADLTFSANILRSKVLSAESNEVEARRQLSQLLSIARSDREVAAVHFELWLIDKENEISRKEATRLYESLFAKTPQYLYRIRLEALKGEKAG